MHTSLTTKDIWPLETFIAQRPHLMPAILSLKKVRRVYIGPYMTLLFESRELVWWQIQEMLRVEKGGDPQIQDELEAYLPLIPTPHGITATLMVEVADTAQRPSILAQLKGLESSIALTWGPAQSRQEARAESLALAHPYHMPRDKTTSVHFLNFALTASQKAALCKDPTHLSLVVDHPAYQHSVSLSSELVTALTAQLKGEDTRHPSDSLLAFERTSKPVSASSKGVPVAIVGATGNIGRCIVHQLQDDESISLHLAGSRAHTLTVAGRAHPVVLFSSLAPCKIYIFATQASVALQFIPSLLSQDPQPFVLDSSSAFRGDPTVPLMVPLLNSDSLTQQQKLYAHPNCVASPLSLVLSPLLSWGIKNIFVSTYQSTSGAGWQAMNSCRHETDRVLKGQALSENPYFPRNIAFNAFPQVGDYYQEGATEEEQKISDEVKKILSLTVPMHVTSVRVPTLQGHGMSVSVECERPIDLCHIKEVMGKAPGVKLSDRGYHSPLEVIGMDSVFVGRLRQTSPHYLSFWVCSDNLRRGGATDLVETAKGILKRFF